MTLPKLNASPKFTTKIPSTGKSVRFRPYLVKEDKVLMIAYESGDSATVLSTVLDTIEACYDEIDARNLTLFDCLHLFSILRSKSVGEVVELNIECAECNALNPVDVDLEKSAMYEIEGTIESETAIALQEDMDLIVAWPTMKDVIQHPEVFTSKSQTELGLIMLKIVLREIRTEEEISLFKEASDNDIEEFIGSLNARQFASVNSYIKNLPVMKYKIDFECRECKHKNTMELEDPQDFF